MSVRLQYSQVINKPLAAVFRFFATEHIRNHPRWDSDIELEPTSDEPIGVGTVIRRSNTRSGRLVEGTMEVTEYQLNEAFSTVIHEGGMEITGRSTFAALGNDQTRLTITIDLPGMDESMDTGFLMGRLNEVGEVRKALIESEM